MSGPAIPEHSDLYARALRGVARFLFLNYLRVSFEGREHLPKSGPAMLIPNHPSYLDPALTAYGTKRWVTWLAWDEAFDWPVVGHLCRKMGALPINLDKGQASTLKAAYRVLRKGELLGVFFEGGRTEGYQLDEPKRGAARMALTTRVPVIPVSLAGVRRTWPRDGVPLPGKVVVRYHAPIDPREIRGGTKEAREEVLTERVREALGSGLPEDGRPDRDR